MKKNAYYATVFQRRNFLKDFFYGAFHALASWPRLVLEVFIRRNMGERYFSLFGVMVIALLLVCFPIFKAGVYSGWFDVIKENLTWYLFTAAFVFAGVMRQREITRLPSVFDFKRFSLSTGSPLPKLYEVAAKYNLPLNPRRIATLIEPGVCLLAGLFLCLLRQPIGVLIAVCSVIYSLSYVATYAQGDDFLMDYIDNVICQEDLFKTYTENLPPNETRGADVFGHRSNDPEMRRKAAGAFEAEDIAFEVVS